MKTAYRFDSAPITAHYSCTISSTCSRSQRCAASRPLVEQGYHLFPCPISWGRLCLHKTRRNQCQQKDRGQQQEARGVGSINTRSNPAIHRFTPFNEYGGNRDTQYAAKLPHITDHHRRLGKVMCVQVPQCLQTENGQNQSQTKSAN